MAQVLTYGPKALLLQARDTTDALGLYRAVLAAGLPVIEVVPAARTVLLRFADAGSCAASRPAVGDLTPLGGAKTRVAEVRIPVTYDGADLEAVAELTGLSAGEVIARHTGAIYDVAFIGFAPGFGYLTGLDPRLHVPRLESPRTSVPPGSVAIAGPYAAVYPTSSPGGWRLLGRTALPVFDVAREPPALLGPGGRVRFVEATT